jgi:TP901 family phage tail tape measure protein
MPVRSVKTRLTIDVNDYVSGVNKAEMANARFGAKASTVLKGVATGYAAIKVGGLVADSVKLEAQYSKTMAQVAVATNAPKSQLKELDRLALKMGADTVFSAQDSGEAMLSLAKGGLSTAQIRAGALADTLTLASAGNLELKDSADTVVSAMGAFRLKASQTDEAVAALAGSANASSADVSDMTQALAQAGTSAHSAGLSIQDTTGYLALLANQGIKGSDAGTSLRTMLSRLVPQTDAAKSAMKSLGLTYLDSNGKLVDAEEIAKRTQDAFKGLSDEQRITAVNAIFGADAQRAINAITAEGDEGLRKYLQSTNDLTQAQKLADAANSGTAGSMEQLSGSIETAQIQIGKGLAPVVQDLADRASDLASSGDLEGWAQSAGEGVADFLDEVGPLAASLADLAMDTLPAVATAGGAVVDILEAGAEVLTPLVDGFNALPDSAQQALLLGAAVASLSTDFGGLRTRTGDALLNLRTMPDDMRNTAVKSAALRAGVGAAGIGMLTFSDRIGKSNQALGDVVSVLGSAATGFAAGGPWGAAVGGAVGLLGTFGDANKHAVADVDALTDSLSSQSGALTANSRKMIQNALEKDGAFKEARRVGADLGDVTDAALGNRAALRRIKAYRDRIAAEQAAIAEAQSPGSGEATREGIKRNFNDLLGSITAQSGAVGEAKQKWDNLNESQARSRELNKLTADQIREVTKATDGIPKRVVSEFTQPGYNKAVSNAAEIARKYNLTPKQVATTLKTLGYADKDIERVLALMAKADKARANPRVTVDTGGALTDLQRIQGYINGMHGKVLKVAVQGGTPGGITTNADGGAIVGPGTGTSDSILSFVSNGEHVLTAAEVQAAGGQGAIYAMRAMLRQGRAPKFATGGAVGVTSINATGQLHVASSLVPALRANTEAVKNQSTVVERQTAAQKRFDRYENLRSDRSSRLDLINQRKQVRDLDRDLDERETVGKGKNKHRRYVLRGLDREAARLELADAKRQLAAMKATDAELAKYGTLKAEQLRLDRAVAAGDFSGDNFSLVGGSVSAVDRNLTRMISDSAEFTQILSGLKAKGASPWLLQKLQEAGPTKTALRLGRQYLNDQTALDSLNAQVGRLSAVSGAFGELTADPRFSASAAWGGLSSTTRTTLVQIQALDVSSVTAEIQRVVRHELATIADGGGA